MILSLVTISIGKRFVIVDGVGYPSVGSICNLSNAHIAQALGSPVLLIGKPGVGDAVDSFNINAKYFESYGSLKFAFNVFNMYGLNFAPIIRPHSNFLTSATHQE
jgi:hypothetical protein